MCPVSQVQLLIAACNILQSLVHPASHYPNMPTHSVKLLLITLIGSNIARQILASRNIFSGMHNVAFICLDSLNFLCAENSVSPVNHLH